MWVGRREAAGRQSYAVKRPLVEQPQGTVTFLFTDVEGSTRLLSEVGGDRYAQLLEQHQRVARDAFDRHGGYEVDSEGDSFFVAFQSARSAVTAAAEGAAMTFDEAVVLALESVD